LIIFTSGPEKLFFRACLSFFLLAARKRFLKRGTPSSDLQINIKIQLVIQFIGPCSRPQFSALNGGIDFIGTGARLDCGLGIGKCGRKKKTGSSPD